MQPKKKSPISLKNREISPDDESRLFAVELGDAPQIDLHGLDAHTAVIELDYFLNRAYAQKSEGIQIIHGLGTGVLRTAVHRHLQQHRLVKAFRNAEHANKQGGMTVAIFKLY